MERSALVEVPVQVAYGVVADVSQYPEFLPGCAAVTIRETQAHGLVAAVTVRAKGFEESFVTRNTHGSDTIEMAIAKTFPHTRTRDLGGEATTQAFTAELNNAIKATQ